MLNEQNQPAPEAPAAQAAAAAAAVSMGMIKTPSNMDFESDNVASRWKSWREELTLYVGLALQGVPEQKKIDLFKYLVGPEGREVLRTVTPEIPHDEHNPLTLEKILQAFDRRYGPKSSETVDRYRFFKRDQAAGEGFDRYLTELRKLANSCSFGAVCDSLIRDRIVCGIKDAPLRERLLREADLTLDKAIALCRAAELSKEQSRTLDTKEVVHALKQPQTQHHKSQNKPFSQHRSQQHKQQHYKSPQKPPQNYKQENAPQQSSARKLCLYCGYPRNHGRDKCPANGAICHKCKGKDHFAKMCGAIRRRVHTVQEEEVDDYYTVLSVGQESRPAAKPIFAYMDVMRDKGESTRVKFQIDTGASCNVVPVSIVPKGWTVSPSRETLVVYGGTTMTSIGSTTLNLVNPVNNKRYKARCIVVSGNDLPPILGNSTSQIMELVEVKYDNICLKRENICRLKTAPMSKETLLQQYSDVFEGTGKFEGQYHIETDPDVTPKVHPPRKMPIATMDKLKSELDSLVSQGIIRPVTEPTPWVSSLVVIDKPGKLRICADLRDLNVAVRREHYPLPTVEDILPKLGKAKVFSVFDAKNGYWHVKLDDESALLTTFNTPFGRYCWLRMPMGIKSGAEVFQQYQDQAIEGLRQTHCVADDILIYGEGDTIEEATEDHDVVMKNLMQRCRERNLKINPKKIRLRHPEIPFVGHLVTGEGVRADPEKVKALQEMPNPENVADVQRFLGFVNYLSKFIPKLSDHVEPLRLLTHKDVLWHWTEEHEKAMKTVKELVSDDVKLRYYDKEKPLVLQCDASDFGLGACIMQEGAPIAFASRRLTPTERGYAQIEKELLSVVFGIEKFHTYTYGRPIFVESDHKPLESIVRKQLHMTPKRLQRMLLRLQGYDINLRYRPGREMTLADTLSRAPRDSQQSEPEKNIENVNMIGDLPVSEPTLNEIAAHTSVDPDMQILKSLIVSGWPESKNEVPFQLRGYFPMRDELSVQDELLFKGERIIIPATLRRKMLNKIHQSHMGREGCLRRAREAIYWPGMNSDVVQLVDRCQVCQSLPDKQQKETLNPHDVPEGPWIKVGVDLMEFDGKHYLVTVDYFSNFWEVDYLTSPKSESVIMKLKAQFSRHGIPLVVMSDNGPQFDCNDFKRFATKWEFTHVTSSPHYPQSNGKVEGAVKTVKRLLQRAKASGQDPYLAILDFRNTPTQGIDSSPVQRLMSRRTRTLLPIKKELLKPQVDRMARKRIIQSKARQAWYYDRAARDLDFLRPGDTVRIQPMGYQKEWRSATVQREVSPRSYEVVDEQQGMYRRNRRQLRRTSELPPSPQVPDDIQVSSESVADQQWNVQEPATEIASSQDEPPASETREVLIPTEPRRSSRARKSPAYLKDYDRQ